LNERHQPRQAAHAAHTLGEPRGGGLMQNFEYQLSKAAQHDTLPRNRQASYLLLFHEFLSWCVGVFGCSHGGGPIVTQTATAITKAANMKEAGIGFSASMTN
jgi:hypothetical protein